MYDTRKQKYLKQKQQTQLHTFKQMRQSMVVMGTTAVMGMYVSPVTEVLTAKKAVAQAATPATQFLSSIIPAAQKVAQNKDIYASVMIAQAALESGWGTSTLSQAPNYNLFGIKGSYNGNSVNLQTLEDSGNQNYYSIQADFRKYPSYQESLEDYADKIVSGISGAPLFYSGAWKSNTNSYKDATAYLTGRYATDTAYASKLNRIIEQYGLTKYDGETAVALAEDILDKEQSTTTTGYTVEQGDTLYAISRKTGTSISDILANNGLSLQSVIYPGQTIQLTATISSNETKNTTETIAAKPTTDTTKATDEPTEKTTETKQTDATGVYTVVSGDTLYGISRKTGVNISDLLQANSLSLSSVIYPGQQLDVSGKKAIVIAPPVQAPELKTNAISQDDVYTVVSGDTLYGISRKTGVAIQELLSQNGLSLSSTIYPGQSLKTSSAKAVILAPAPQTTEEVTVTTQAGKYTVVSGDTLYGISRKTNTSIQTLLSLNGLSLSSTIYAGQTLQVGEVTATVTPEVVEEKTPAPLATDGTYTIQKGDTLYHIAHVNGLSLTTLLELNGLTATSVIQPGQVLTVQEKAAPQKVAATSSSQEAPTTKTYTVKAGDGLWRIAKNHGLSLDFLKNLNHLTSNIIQPGQVLIVSA